MGGMLASGWLAAATAAVSVDRLSADEAIVAAKDAAQTEDRGRLAALAGRVRGHPLESYVEFWQIVARLRSEEPAQVDAAVAQFFERHPGTFVADRLRLEWLLALGARDDLDTYAREQPALIWGDDPRIRCYSMLVSYQRARNDESAGRDSRKLLSNTKESTAEGCATLADRLIADGRMSAWERVRTLVEQGQPATAKRVASQIKDASPKLTAQAIDSPVRFLALHERRLTGMQRELAVIALARHAADDPAQAARLAAELNLHLTPQQRAIVWGRIGHQAALKLMPEAVDWYRRGGDAVGVGPEVVRGPEVLEWQVRAALRGDRKGTDWAMVRSTIERMPPEQARDSAWVYWRARALAVEKRNADAIALYRSLAGKYDFYGKLALEELGETAVIPPRAAATAADDATAMADRPGFIRALAFYRLGLRAEGHREWNWQLRGMDDRQLLTAAEYARSVSVLDRMISTSERTRGEFDFTQRFPAPHRDELTQAARAVGIDETWVYGLIRQESRFIQDARSSVGAQGLMQLMPATARHVARKTGMTNFSPARVNELDVNLTLGTRYLRMVLDDLDGQPMLATAAYNAGPRRPRAWRAALARPVEGAIFAESIPFTETRTYVKNVMSNAVDYALLFEGKSAPLKQRLGIVGPKTGVEPEPNSEAGAEPVSEPK
jgi:soluble lytic murein transglycosylase